MMEKRRTGRPSRKNGMGKILGKKLTKGANRTIRKGET